MPAPERFLGYPLGEASVPMSIRLHLWRGRWRGWRGGEVEGRWRGEGCTHVLGRSLELVCHLLQRLLKASCFLLPCKLRPLPLLLEQLLPLMSVIKLLLLLLVLLLVL